MGKFKKRRNNKFQSNNGNNGNNERTDSKYANVVKKNTKLESFYNTILDLPEEERAEFWDALRRDLPNSFRFCGSKGHARAVRDLLETRYFPKIQSIEYEGKMVELPRPVPWYPDRLAWWMTTPKNVIRKFPPFSAFQKYLVSETSVGHITRQEVVSMIPPLLLDVRPGHVVLDMCAAPGSKSSQLLEMIHAGEEDRIKKVLRQYAEEDGLDLGPETEEEANADLSADPSDAGRATGLLVANDGDYKRCHMLTHQLKRLSSANLLITNHDATQYPSIKLPPDPANPRRGVYLKFDRVLADVPCSGDGTLRKNSTLWNSWVPGSGLGLHLVQVRILVRALQLLKVGGKVVYSTCSMNPVENESVIAAAIDRCGGPRKVEIVDCSDQLPELKRRPGLKSWKVMDKTGRLWDSWSEVEAQMKDDDDFIAPGKLVESMFPKSEGHPCADLPLERCTRIYAHLQDTGGFFITVLEKKAEFKAKPESSSRSGEAKLQSRPTEEPVKAESLSENPSYAVGELDIKANMNGKRGREEAEDESNVDGQPPVKKVQTWEEANAHISKYADSLTVENEKPNPIPGEPPEKLTVGYERTKPRDASAAADVDVEAPEQTEETSQADTTPKPADVSKAEEKPVKKDTSIRYEEPFRFLPADHAAILDIRKAYRLSERFPLDRFLVRNSTGEPAKAIYYTTTLAKDILYMNDGKGVKFVHGGIKMFMKQDVPHPDICRWRIQAEGMPLVQGYVGQQRVVHLTKRETLRRLLIEMFPKINDGAWEQLGEIGERVRDMEMGCSVLRIDATDAEDGFSESLVLPLWKSIHSLNLMLPKEDRSAMLLRLFNDTTPLVNNSLQMQKEKERKRQLAEEAAAEAARSDDEEGGSSPLAAEVEESTPQENDGEAQAAQEVKMAEEA